MNTSIQTVPQPTSPSHKKQQRPAITNPLKRSHTSEPDSPVTCRKKVMPIPKVQISNCNKEPVGRGRTSSRECIPLTPYKAGSNSNTAAGNSNIKTIKKGQSASNLGFLPPTANKNRHATKFGCLSQQSSSKGSQKQGSVYGKRKATVLDGKENDQIERSLSRNEKTEGRKEVKKLKMTVSEVKKEVKHEKLYFMDSTKTLTYCFPMFYEKDLGYNKFIQTTTKETDIDNDCLTDSEVMENVVKWTMDDLDEALVMHREEKAKDEQEAKVETVNKSSDKVDLPTEDSTGNSDSHQEKSEIASVTGSEREFRSDF